MIALDSHPGSRRSGRAPGSSAFLSLAAALPVAAALLGAGCADPGPPERVPAPLRDVESDAEDAFDQALAGDAAGVRVRATHIDMTWRAFRSRALADGVNADDAGRLDAAIAALLGAPAADADPLARAADAVSAPLDAIFAVYVPVVPAEVLRLDYLGRELLLDGRQSDFAAAGGHHAALGGTWSALRPRVVAARGAADAQAFDVGMGALGDALAMSDAAALTGAASAELDLVDRVETVFARAADPAD